jgi:DNA-binding NtrC family response regulator
MKIALIDDELAILESLERALKPTGYECFPFQSPKDALEDYTQEKFDVVITDFMMPGMNGIEVLKAIKEINPEAFVILITGYADIENAIAAVNHGAYAFFRKPFDFRDFITTLRQIEDKINGVKQKEVDMDCFLAEYARLKSTFESLQQVVQRLSTVQEEK